MRTGQRGASIAIILVVLALVMVAFMATYALSRFSGSSGERGTTETRMKLVADAIEQFAATTQRLPCPARPGIALAADTGLEVRNGDTCHNDVAEGVVPWKTLGLRPEDTADAWGRRISYRVYTAANGSLTRDNGVSMVTCDTAELDPAVARDATADKRCKSAGSAYNYTTSPANFLNGKGLAVSDMGSNVADGAAYVLISHGATGLGAYTVSGARLDLPSGDERDNTRQTGPFKLKAFSASNVFPKDNDFFDDLVFYRRLADLVAKVGLAARDWPDPPVGSTRFDVATVNALATEQGATPSGTNTGTAIIDFGGAVVIGLANGNTSNISADTAGSAGGIGVVGGGNSKVTYSEGEYLVAVFDNGGRRFGITLADFGTYLQSSVTLTETVRFYFFNGGTFVHLAEKQGCRADGGLATFDVAVPSTYDGVIIYPMPATGMAGGTPVTSDTGFLVSEIRTCTASASSCPTSYLTSDNTCP